MVRVHSHDHIGSTTDRGHFVFLGTRPTTTVYLPSSSGQASGGEDSWVVGPDVKEML